MIRKCYFVKKTEKVINPIRSQLLNTNVHPAPPFDCMIILKADR